MAFLSSLMSILLDLYSEINENDENDENKDSVSYVSYIPCSQGNPGGVYESYTHYESSDDNKFLEALCELSDNIIKKIKINSDNNYENIPLKIIQLTNYNVPYTAYTKFNSLGNIYINVIEENIININYSCMNDKISFLEKDTETNMISFTEVKKVYVGAEVIQTQKVYEININIIIRELLHSSDNKSKIIFDGKILKYFCPKYSFTSYFDKSHISNTSPLDVIQRIERNPISYSNLHSCLLDISDEK
jgi:hypothetical protein